MVFTEELLISAVAGVADKRLLYRDLAVLMALMANVNWRSGKAHVTQRCLADQLQMQPSHVSTSIKRLREEGLLARALDQPTGQWHFIVNPRLASVGSPQRRGHLFQQFDEALEKEIERQ